MRKIAGIALVAVVTLAGCGSQDVTKEVSTPVEKETTPEPVVEATEEPTTEAPVEPTEPEPFLYPGVELGDQDQQIAEVGETVTIPDSQMRMSWADVTLEGMARYETDGTEDGRLTDVSIMVFSIENHQEEPVEFLAPVDGGGLYYIAPDNTATMLYNQAEVTYAWDYAGYEVARWHRGPYGPGDRQVVTQEFLTTPNGDDFGSLQYRTADGYVVAQWDVMFESQGKDHPRLVEMQRAVDDMGFVFEED